MSVDKPVADPYLPDAITASLGSTVEYNKMCQSDVGKAPAGCKRKKHPNMDADLAATAVMTLKGGGGSSGGSATPTLSPPK